MNARELLELAAKAAGVEIKVAIGDTLWRPDGIPWNPLTNDGDALRLAVQLKLIVTFTDNLGPCVSVGRRLGPFSHEPMPILHFNAQRDSDLAATRRAIVRAAAELAKEAA